MAPKQARIPPFSLYNNLERHSNKMPVYEGIRKGWDVAVAYRF